MKKSWQRTNESTFRAHLDLFRDAGEDVREHEDGDRIIYHTGNGESDEYVWVGKVDISTSEPAYYIALTDE